MARLGYVKYFLHTPEEVVPMKTTAFYLAGAVVGLSVLAMLAVHLHAPGHSPATHGFALHGAADAETAERGGTVTEGPVTVSFAQNDDFYLCNDPFWLAVYEMMKEVYAIGIENVTVELLQEKTFAFMRSWPDFTPEQAEGWVEHVKDIPAQFVVIIQEDPAVLDNCANFSVAAVGPP